MCEPSEILLTSTRAFGHSFNLHVGFQGPGWLYMLRMPSRGDVGLWTPGGRITDLSQGLNLLRGPGGLPVCRGGESTGNHPQPAEKTRPKGQKNTLIYMYKAPIQ